MAKLIPDNAAGVYNRLQIVPEHDQFPRLHVQKHPCWPAVQCNAPAGRKRKEPHRCGSLVEVPKEGLEPSRLAAHAPETCASTNSATSVAGKF